MVFSFRVLLTRGFRFQRALPFTGKCAAVNTPENTLGLAVISTAERFSWLCFLSPFQLRLVLSPVHPAFSRSVCAADCVGHLSSYCFSLPSSIVAVSSRVILPSHRFAGVYLLLCVYTKVRRVVLERKRYFCAGLSQSTNRNNQTNQQRNKQKTLPCSLLAFKA